MNKKLILGILAILVILALIFLVAFGGEHAVKQTNGNNQNSKTLDENQITVVGQDLETLDNTDFNDKSLDELG
jgi:hypothetical protein